MNGIKKEYAKAGGGVLPPAVRQHDRTEYELFLGVALK